MYISYMYILDCLGGGRTIPIGIARYHNIVDEIEYTYQSHGRDNLLLTDGDHCTGVSL